MHYWNRINRQRKYEKDNLPFLNLLFIVQETNKRKLIHPDRRIYVHVKTLNEGQHFVSLLFSFDIRQSLFFRALRICYSLTNRRWRSSATDANVTYWRNRLSSDLLPIHTKRQFDERKLPFPMTMSSTRNIIRRKSGNAIRKSPTQKRSIASVNSSPKVSRTRYVSMNVVHRSLPTPRNIAFFFACVFILSHINHIDVKEDLVRAVENELPDWKQIKDDNRAE